MTVGLTSAPRLRAAGAADPPPPAATSREIKTFPRVLGQTYLVLAVLIGFGVMPIRPRYHYLVVLLGLGTVMIVGKRALMRARFVIPMTLYIILAIASMAWSVQPHWTFYDLRFTEALIAVTMLVASVLPLDAVLRAEVRAIEAACLVTAYYLAAHPETRLLNQLDPSLGNAWRGGFDHKNELAIFAAFCIPWILAFGPTRRRRQIAVVALIVLVLGSRSATGLIGLTVALFTWCWVGLMQHRAARRRAMMVGFTVPLITVALFGVWASLTSIADSLGKDPTLSGRTKIWHALWPKIFERPWLGYGPSGLYGGYVNQWNVDVIREVGFFHTHTHNGFLEVQVALGVVGLALAMALVASTIIGAIRLFDEAPNIARWALACIMPLLVMSVSERTFTNAGWFSAVVIIRIVELTVLPSSNRKRRFGTVARRWTHGDTATRQRSRSSRPLATGAPLLRLAAR